MTEARVREVVEWAHMWGPTYVTRAARSKFLPPEELVWIIKEKGNDFGFYDALRFAAKNPNLPLPAMEEIVNEILSPTTKARSGYANYVFENRSMPGVLLERFVSNYFPLTPETVVNNWALLLAFRHPNLPLKWMKIGAKSDNSSIRIQVASNPALTVPLQKLLLQDTNMSIRRAVARNKATSPELVKTAANATTDTRFLSLAAKNLDGVARQEAVDALLATSTKSSLAQKAVARYTTNPEHLNRLAYNGSSDVRRVVLENPATRDEDKVVAVLLG